MPVLGVACAALGLDWYGRRGLPAGRWDVAVVPGCRVMPDGRASSALRRRCERAARLWREGRVTRVLVSGGIGADLPSERSFSEGSVGVGVCRDAGVPDAALVVEDRARTTRENARFSYETLGPLSVVVVTDGYHTWRCRRLFAAHFREVVTVGVQPPPRSRLRLTVREVVAVARHLLLD